MLCIEFGTHFAEVRHFNPRHKEKLNIWMDCIDVDKNYKLTSLILSSSSCPQVMQQIT